MVFILMSQSQDWVNQYGTLNEKMFLGMTMALVGMVIVFLMLIIIVIAIVLMSKILKSIQIYMSGHHPALTSTPVIPTDASLIGNQPQPVVMSDDLSLIAVITAAVSMMMSDQSGGSALYPGFRVKSIRRIR